MSTMRFVIGICALALMLLGSGAVSGQDYPTRSIRLLTQGVGGTTDITTRLIAQALSVPLGQPVVVDNRPSGVIGEVVVAKAPPDGYTLLVAGSSFWVGPLLQNMPYDPVGDFAPISLTNRSPGILVVHPSLPVTSVKELIALAKAKPGALNYSTGALGAAPQMAAELFNSMAGVKIVKIAYGGGSARVAALLSGEVQLEFSPAGVVLPYVQSGKLRALAVTTIQPTALAPNLPTIAAAGLPGYDYATNGGIFAPAKTPDAIIKRLNQELVRFLKSPEAKEKFLSSGGETVGSSPEEFAAFVKSETTRLAKLIKDAGIRPQ